MAAWTGGACTGGASAIWTPTSLGLRCRHPCPHPDRAGGDSGTGQSAKLCNNLVLGVSMAAVSEALALGKRLGLVRLGPARCMHPQGSTATSSTPGPLTCSPGAAIACRRTRCSSARFSTRPRRAVGARVRGGGAATAAGHAWLQLPLSAVGACSHPCAPFARTSKRPPNPQLTLQHGAPSAVPAAVLAAVLAAAPMPADTYNPVPGAMEGVPSARGYKGGFASQLMQKDLGLVVRAAEHCGAATPLSRLARELYSQCDPTLDFCSIYKQVYSKGGSG